MDKHKPQALELAPGLRQRLDCAKSPDCPMHEIVAYFWAHHANDLPALAPGIGRISDMVQYALERDPQADPLRLAVLAEERVLKEVAHYTGEGPYSRNVILEQMAQCMSRHAVEDLADLNPDGS